MHPLPGASISYEMKGQVLHSQARELIAKVISFMKQEAEQGINFSLEKLKDRVLTATGISELTSQRQALHEFCQLYGVNKEKLVPSLPPKFVLVIDNAPYHHNVLSEQLPTMQALKWLLLGIILLTTFLIKNKRYRWIYILSKTYKRDIRLASIYGKLQILVWYWEHRNRTVSIIFSSIAKKNPQKVAIFFEDEVWTYDQLEDFSNKIARYFKNQGYRKGDCISLLLENRPEYLGIWLGLSKIGVVTALINTNLVSSPLVHSISVSKSKGIIFGSNHAQTIKNVKVDLNALKFYQFHEQLKENKEILPDSSNLREEIESISSDPVGIDYKPSVRDPLLFIYTSGTTGLPKAALISNIRYMFVALALYLSGGLTPNDILYDPLPLYHTAGGMLGAGNALLMGVTLVIRNKFSASNYWKDCAKYKATYAQYIGEMCRYILSAPNVGNVKHNLKAIVGNGLRPQIWKQFTDRFNIKQVYELYGATEGISNMINVSNIVGCIGSVPRYVRWLYPVTLIKCNEATGEPIRNSNGRCIECEVNEPGLLIGKINQKKALFSFKGYSDDEATEKKILQNVFTDGDYYFNSGDILVSDEFGNFFFKDRTGDTFRWKGENVSTAEVEAVISNIVQLNDAVVYGIEIPGSEGKAGMAAIVDTNKTLDVVALCNGLKGNLPSYAIPIFLRVMESIQLTGTYKLKKVELQAEGFDVNKIKDKLYFYNSKLKQYEILRKEKYEEIVAGKLNL
ncbi:hypothetical protein ILUMI_05326 [Ignelater luminosus]|uniref:Very long-chain fatty acid transport protein n=1 Tax=Ignelater luminosus TaxID=2038154 RepID=A0A8K0DAQ3_IGNLU|nr:hypothetical protein ILUMI_05326 [Ignelater luminosus]